MGSRSTLFDNGIFILWPPHYVYNISMKTLIRRLPVLVVFIFLSSCFAPESIEGSGIIANKLVKAEVVQSRMLNQGGTKFHMMTRNASSSNLVVFIHGTPGEWTIFSPQMRSEVLAGAASLVAIERPGWGLSETSQKDKILSLAEQSGMLGPALKALKEEYRSDNLVIVGHSLGGSLVPRIAMDFPQLIDAVVVIAGDLTDDYSPAHWYNDVASWWAIRWMIPGIMQRANEEVLQLAPDLAAMKPLWGKITAPLLVVQGVQDGLVDPRHADFAERVETSGPVKVIRFEQGDHLLHLSDAKSVNKIIAEVVNRESSRIFER